MLARMLSVLLEEVEGPDRRAILFTEGVLALEISISPGTGLFALGFGGVVDSDPDGNCGQPADVIWPIGVTVVAGREGIEVTGGRLFLSLALVRVMELGMTTVLLFTVTDGWDAG